MCDDFAGDNRYKYELIEEIVRSQSDHCLLSLFRENLAILEKALGYGESGS